ncbi:MAG: EcsC family protein [Rubrobacter sp.]|nr:EcsC family protein [Rubrobacter sp.]
MFSLVAVVNAKLRTTVTCGEAADVDSDPNALVRVLDWAYDKAIDGVPGLETAEEMGENYLKGDGSLQDKVDSLIRWQVVKASTSGFVTGLGGVLTLPVAIPANLASVMYIQLRMAATIAYMGGHDVQDDRVKALCYACLCGSAAIDVLKDAGIKTGTALTKQGIKRLPFEVIKRINQAVGRRVIAKGGTTEIVNLSIRC